MESAGIIVVGSKKYGFCDAHLESVMSENAGAAKRARKRSGMPSPPKANALVPGRHDDIRKRARCAVDGCGRPLVAVMFTARFPKEMGGIPVCGEHWSAAVQDNIEWDGVWHKFISGCQLDQSPLFEDNEVVTAVVESASANEVVVTKKEASEKVDVEVALTEEEDAFMQELLKRYEDD